MLPGQDYTAADIGTCKEVTVLTGLDLLTQSTTRFCSSACRLSSEWKERHWPGSPILPKWPDSVPYVKIGQQQSTAIQLEVSIPQGSVLGVDPSCSHTKWPNDQVTTMPAALAAGSTSNHLPTSWRYWHTRSRPNWCQRIWVVTSSYVTPCGLYATRTNWFSEQFASTAFANSAMCNPLFWSGHLQLTATH